MPLRCDHCLLHFTSRGITGWERNVTSMKNTNALDQKTDSTERLLFWCEVWWRYLVNSVLACRGVGEVEGCSDSISRHQSGAAIKSPASARGSNMSQSQQSSTGSQEDPGQTAGREQIDVLDPADSARKHRFPSEMWEWPSGFNLYRWFSHFSLLLFFSTGLKAAVGGNVFICDGPFWHKR